MRHLWILLIALIVLILAAFDAGGQTPPQPNPQANAPTQALPDAPSARPVQATAPAPPLDPLWNRVQELGDGQPIVVYSSYGPPLHCRFAGATDTELFCDAPNSPAGTGYRFDRANVINVRVARPVRNWHPAWLASMIAGGMVVGICATVNADAGEAARDGLIGAGVVGVIGAPLAFLPRDESGMAFRPLSFAHASGLWFGQRLHLGRTR